MQSPATTSGISNCYCFVTITSLDVSWHPTGHYSVAQQRSIRCHLTQESKTKEYASIFVSLCSNDRSAGTWILTEKLLYTHFSSHTSHANKPKTQQSFSCSTDCVLPEHGAEVASFSCIIIKKAEVNTFCTVNLSHLYPPTPRSLASQNLFYAINEDHLCHCQAGTMNTGGAGRLSTYFFFPKHHLDTALVGKSW